MAVDHAQRARWASRVLRLRQGGLRFSLDDVRSTAGTVEQTDPEVDGSSDAHVVGASGHPLSGLIRSFTDIDDETYVSKLFDMDIDTLVEEWRKETANAHEQMVSDGAMTRKELDACYKSQDEDEQTYQEQAEDMSETGSWPGYHRLGHGVAMQREAND